MNAVAFTDARRALIRILQDAHAGERAAAYAYRGHWRSIRAEPLVCAEIRRIEQAEWHHRSIAHGLLAELGAHPRPGREMAMALVGRFFGLLCHVGGRFGPMFAAGRLEAQNVEQYADARACAEALCRPAMAAVLAAMVEEEVRHEVFFAEQCRDHWLVPALRRISGWSPSPGRDAPAPSRPVSHQPEPAS